MTAAFPGCLRFVLDKEGGFVDHPNDKGGATNKGVTQAVYDAWRRRRSLLPQSVRLITDDEVAAIYKREYWDRVGGDQLPAPLALAVFDGAVNSGVSRAARWLQRACGTVVDGVVGPGTLAAAKKAVERGGALNLALDIVTMRREFYYDIVDANPSQKVFLRGWINRIDAVEKECKRLDKET